jgi:hypothetical protein
MPPEPRYPPAWEPDFVAVGAPSETCPYTTAEVEEHLHWNHYHWSHKEPPLTFHFKGMVGELAAAHRRYWACELADDWGRRWIVVVGSGRSPSQSNMFTRRWMLAFDESDFASPQQLLDDVNRDDLEHDARSV